MSRTCIVCELKKLRWRMFRTNFFFHLIRNNPRHRERHYFALIAIVGYSDWENVNNIVRLNWESARNSFDRMYGMVKDFVKHPDVYESLFTEKPVPPKEEKKEEPDELKLTLKNLLETNTKIFSELENTKKQLDSISSAIPSWTQLKDVRDALNNLNLPE